MDLAVKESVQLPGRELRTSCVLTKRTYTLGHHSTTFLGTKNTVFCTMIVKLSVWDIYVNNFEMSSVIYIHSEACVNNSTSTILV